MSAPSVGPTAVLEQLGRILASSGFAKNNRLSRFLAFVIERRLAGRDEEIKESIIAVEVFGRSPEYDPKQDSIVRTEAARLRARLQEYYGTDGREDPVLVEIPKGSYVPAFRRVASDTVPLLATGGRLRRWALTAAVVVMCAVVWILWSPADAPRVAVLPLKNLRHDSSSDYFADGLTDEIIRKLSLTKGLAVRSRTSSFALRDAPRNAGELGRRLGADYLVEGSVLQLSNDLRVNVQLARVRDDLTLWSGRFDGQVGRIFEIQDEISRAVVETLRLKLAAGARRYETDTATYDLYLRARSFALRGGIRGIHDSIGPLEQVVARDPSFAPAHALLGSAYAIRSVQFPLRHPPDELTKMRAAAQRAMQLDPRLGEAHRAMALAYARDSQWKQSEQYFRQALAIDPDNAETYTSYAMWLLHVIGRNDEALKLLRTAEQLDPLSPAVNLGLGWVLTAAGRYKDADVYCSRMRNGDVLQPQCRARAAIGLGRVGDAIALLKDEPSGASPGFLGYAYARAGQREEAERIAAAVAPVANQAVLVFAGLGDTDRALEALGRMKVLGAQRIGQYVNYPELASLRGDPRLRQLLDTIGLP